MVSGYLIISWHKNLEFKKADNIESFINTRRFQRPMTTLLRAPAEGLRGPSGHNNGLSIPYGFLNSITCGFIMSKLT